MSSVCAQSSSVLFRGQLQSVQWVWEATRKFCFVEAENPWVKNWKTLIEDVRLMGKHTKKGMKLGSGFREFWIIMSKSGWRDGSAVKNMYVLVEDPSSVPSPHVSPHSPMSATPPPSSGLHIPARRRTHTHQLYLQWHFLRFINSEFSRIVCMENSADD